MTGMILSVAPIGEYDKRVVILTKKKGKYQRLQKGRDDRTVRLQGLVHLVISENSCCMKGRNSNTLQSAEIENYFAELRTDVEAAYYAFYFSRICRFLYKGSQ